MQKYLMIFLAVFGFMFVFASQAKATDTAIFIKVQLWNDTNRNGLKDAGESWSGSGIRTEGAFVDVTPSTAVPCGQTSYEYDVVFTTTDGFAYYKNALPFNHAYCIDNFKVQGKCLYNIMTGQRTTMDIESRFNNNAFYQIGINTCI